MALSNSTKVTLQPKKTRLKSGALKKVRNTLRLLLPSLVTFLVVAGIANLAVSTERSRLFQDLKSRVSHDVVTRSVALEAELNATIFLANGMIPLVSVLVDPGDEVFTTALETLYRYGRHIRNIGVAPGNRLTHIYPRAGNEAAIGLYYPDAPKQWPAVKQAIDTRQTVLAGPLTLRQGGQGVIVRTPVFLDDDSYWGLVSLVLDVESLLDAVGLTAAGDGIQFALRGTNGTGADGPVFFGSPEVFQGDPVTQLLTVPGGHWQVGAVPVGGWRGGQDYLTGLGIAAVLLALGLALIVHAYQDGRRRLAASERRARAIMETAGDGLIVIDETGTIQEFNPAAQRLFGYDRAEAVGLSVNRLMPAKDAAHHDRHIKTFRPNVVRSMSRGRQIVGVRRDGSTFPAEITIGDTVLGQQRLHVGAVRDITERKAFERKLVEMASIDELTQVLNRRAFLEEARSRLDLAARTGRPLCFLMVDADHFKAVNDTYGHPVGDAVLVRLAQVARSCLRDADRLGRLGGEEFAVLLPDTDPADALHAAERLRTAVHEIQVPTGGADGKTIGVTVSIGVSGLAGADRSLEALMQAADVALYRAKAEGRDRVCFHDVRTADQGSDDARD